MMSELDMALHLYRLKMGLVKVVKGKLSWLLARLWWDAWLTTVVLWSLLLFLYYLLWLLLFLREQLCLRKPSCNKLWLESALFLVLFVLEVRWWLLSSHCNFLAFLVQLCESIALKAIFACGSEDFGLEWAFFQLLLCLGSCVTFHWS